MEDTRQTRVGECSVVQFNALISLIRQHLEELSNIQTLLSSTRKELLVERERVKTVGRAVQQKRVTAGNAEAKFMKRLREFVNSYPGQLSNALLDAYDEVGQARDDLGEAEENYLQTEADLTGAEWTFLNRENRFYQFDLSRVLLHSHLDDLVPLYNQPSDLPAHASLDHLPPCPAGSLSPSQVSKLPPPPPPPPPSFPQMVSGPRIPAASASSSLVDRGYAAMLTETNSLKKEFGQLHQKKVCDLTRTRANEALFADGDGALEIELTTSTSEYSDILYDISTPEANAQRFKAEGLDLALNAATPTRRHSHSTYSSRATPKFSTPMRRTQTENASLFNRCSPATKQKIQEWSLKHLKEDVIQKRLYLNTLEDNGIRSPVEGDWEDRATHFWSKDSLNEAGCSNEPCLGSGIRTECEPQSYQDQSVTQSITSSVLMQHQLEGNLNPNETMTPHWKPRGPHETQPENVEDAVQAVPLLSSASPHHVADDIEINNGDETVILVAPSLNEQQNTADPPTPPETVVNQPRCTYLAQFDDAAQRKDSVQSTNTGHHPDCAMAKKRNHKINPRRSVQERHEIETTMVLTTMFEHRVRTLEHQSADSHSRPPSGSDHTEAADVMMNFDDNVQPLPSRSDTRRPAPSALVKTTKRQPTDSPATSNPWPISQGRRGTTGWVRSFFPSFRTKQIKSTPSVGQFPHVARV